MTAPAATLDASEVVVGTANGPGLYLAPAGTAPPAPGADWAAPWSLLGYASDDGVTVSGDTTNESLTPWQSTTPIRTIITEVTRTVQFVLWQLNATTLGLYFDTDVTAPAADGDPLSFDVPSSPAAKVYAVGVDVKDGETILRLVWPRASLDSTGDMAITKGAAVPLDVTLSALDANGIMVHVDVFPADFTASQGSLTVAATPAA
jgi:hypothetical protein